MKITYLYYLSPPPPPPYHQILYSILLFGSWYYLIHRYYGVDVLIYGIVFSYYFFISLGALHSRLVQQYRPP
ncbi:MAG: hypothetical protein ACTTH7_03435 [Treponema sp.]